MNWDDLRVLLAVARSGSISKAARALNMDTATAGRRIARLERALGASLFARSPSGYHITEAGADYYERAKLMELQLLDREAAGGLRGNLRIGAPDGCASFILPQIVRRLRDEHPALRIEIVALSRPFDLMRKEVDIAIAVHPHGSKSVTSREIAHYELVLAAHCDLCQDGEPKLNAHGFVGYIDDLLIDPSLNFDTSGFEPQFSLNSNSVIVQWNWLRQGAGVGMVHDFALASAPELRAIYPEHNQKRSYYACRVKSRDGYDHLEEIEAVLALEIAREIDRLRSRGD